MTEAFGFSFVGKRMRFGLYFDMMYITLSLPMPNLDKKDSIYFDYTAESIVKLVQLGALSDMPHLGDDWYHAK